ncbi:MAG: PA domain-containing protein [Gemmatimonadaceae bacterium]
MNAGRARPMWALARALVTCAMVVWPLAARAQVMRLVGHSDLGGAGLNGDITIVGTTAAVAAGLMPAAGVHAHLYNPYPCPAVAVKLVDLSRPDRPTVVSTIPVPAGVAAHGVSATRVHSPSFTGDLLAIALSMCGNAGNAIDRGVVYYDITRPAAPRLLGRYVADEDIVHADSVPPCGAAPRLSPTRCASSQHSVSLIQRADGRVLSLSIEPGASASKYPSGDLRIVDVTDPRHPQLVGAFPEAGAPIFSNNGCRPFSAGHGAGFSHDGRRGLLAFYDAGLFVLDLPVSGRPAKLGQFTYPNDRRFEGSAAYVASARVDGRDLALISEADFIGPTTTLSIEGSSPIAGTRFACEAIFTLYDRQAKAQLYSQPEHAVSGDLAYVGRGCPASHGMDMMHTATATTEADPYLADVNGRIALVDRSRQPIQAGLSAGSGCSVSERVRLAQSKGARAVVLLQTSATAPQAFSADGDPADIAIPVIMIDKGDGDALRAALCPTLESGRCVPSAPITARMRDEPGEWGALRVLDVSDPAAPREIGVYRTPNSSVFPPRDLGVLSPQRAAVRGQYAAVPWNSDGVRVIDLSARPLREIAHFVPPDAADPIGVLPPKAYVVGVALLSPPVFARGTRPVQYIAVSDVNSGLYVVEAPWSVETGRAPARPQRIDGATGKVRSP